MTRIRTILHPTDFSEPSACAFRLACSLARDYGAKLLVLHARQIPVALTGNPDAFPPEPQEVEEALRKRLYAVRADDARVVVEHYLMVGDEADEIVHFAEKKGCDLIVMGTHGRTGLGRLLMGSVAEQVVRKAPCAVVTVKQPGQKGEVPLVPAAPVRQEVVTRDAAWAGT
jgi:nucleotide-binding universal stress UspA family protein